ncbi:hypothetical protein BE11_17000 [Sorangium cellulosum]|nr:hypothetical protein BE11_17000 [Sorangium cellulosum]
MHDELDMTIRLPMEECGIDTLAGVLLRFCRDHAAMLRSIHDNPSELDHLTKWSLEFSRWFEEEIDSDVLSTDELITLDRKFHDVVHMLTQAVKQQARAEVIVARAVAEGLDGALGHRFVAPFQRRIRVKLNTGDPFPVPRRPLKEIFAQELGTNPDRMGIPIDSLPHLRILQSVGHGHEILLSLEHENALATLSAGTRVAVLIPSDVRDLEWDTSSPGERPVFYNVRPRDSEQQTKTVLKLLEDSRGQAEIVILPELCIDGAGLEAIKRWYAQSGDPFAMLVCGSIHVIPEDGAGWRNISTSLLAGGGTIEHVKFNPFSIVSHDETGKGMEYREGIRITPSKITLYLCGTWTFTILICKDFLEPGAMHILEELRPGLILVPSCSPKTQPFEMEAGHLALRAQALVVVANLTDPSADQVSAILAKPLKKDPVEAFRRTTKSPPAMYIFQVGPPARKGDR